jgi:gluconate 2-dehydrogenase gamma chain
VTTPEKFDERAGDTSDDALQNPPRRRFLRGAAAVIPIASVGAGAAGGLAAARSTHAAEVAQGAVTTPEVTYKPVYFQPTEWDFLHAAMDRLIPRDHLGPGAVDAGVPEFLDRQMQLPYGLGHLWYMDGPFVTDAPPELGYQLKLAPRDIYRTGIAAVNAYCIRTLGHAFSELDEPSRDKVLLGLEKGTITLGDAVPPKIFFSLLLDNTREGFLSDPMYGGNKNMIGWKFAGFPGARADFLDWVDHPNEPYPLGPVSILEKRG